ncbi:FAD-binding oxidoreductase [Sandaracinus amylolyticus]|uniref:FAD-binding oxidoreductase n=1 Tax=Sandaracinus amylolyticus TaxID=927083 RepID=UPI001F48D5B2|nr:FAD-binding oxidoreductase [Sandaracinus amylolyticus]UJR81315.1 Decaprenylphosphoryl-beta-D-ribose oxidase [Sandaracinus amylolyticus]
MANGNGSGLSMIEGWGGIGVPGRELRSENLERVTERAVLSRGLGRSYGDSSLPPASVGEVVNTTLADRLLAFDEETGLMRAEAGLSLFALNRIFLPRGWFVPVTPGTQFVTLGGMVASDVHGKEHHARGCFGEHVTRLKMRVADGRVLWCSDEQHGDLFRATIGGMGLTGHILEVEVRMMRIPTAWILQESRRVDDIDDFIARLKDASHRLPATMGWIDLLTRGKNMGRGTLMAGDFASPDIAPKRFPKPLPRVTMPFELPSWTVDRWSVRAFNTAYYWKHLPREMHGIVHWETFFYPLDMIRHWNRMYGTRGFTQYQCVLPDAAGPSAPRRLLEILTSRGGASMLCVIKNCGPEGKGILSFPMPGTSIALDIPVRDDTQQLVDALNEFVLREGGRIYLTKDQFTRPEHFRAMEPRLPKFQEIRAKWDPEQRIRSAQSVRLFGDKP